MEGGSAIDNTSEKTKTMENVSVLLDSNNYENDSDEIVLSLGSETSQLISDFLLEEKTREKKESRESRWKKWISFLICNCGSREKKNSNF